MKRSFLTSLCLGVALVVAAMLPQAGWAASVDVNGRVIDNGVEIVKGTTMMDQANLQDVMKLNVKLDKKAFTLKNDDETVIIEGTVGQKSMTVNGKKVSLSVAPIVKDGKLWLPLRPLMEPLARLIGMVAASVCVRILTIPHTTSSKMPRKPKTPLNMKFLQTAV